MSETKLQIQGHPIASFEFEGLPSVNTHYGKHWRARATPTAEWRYEAKEKAEEFIGWDSTPVIRTRALVVVWVYPPYEEISDIHNVHIKPLLDGFSDAGLWVDDEWAFVPLVLFAFGGIGEQKPRQHKIRRTRIDIYEIGMFIVRDTIHKLPRGRKKLYG